MSLGFGSPNDSKLLVAEGTVATPGIVDPAFHNRHEQTRLVERWRDVFA